jgi:hypothetical protein
MFQRVKHPVLGLVLAKPADEFTASQTVITKTGDQAIVRKVHRLNNTVELECDQDGDTVSIFRNAHEPVCFDHRHPSHLYEIAYQLGQLREMFKEDKLESDVRQNLRLAQLNFNKLAGSKIPKLKPL